VESIQLNIHGSPKSKPPPNDQKIVLNRSKFVNEIWFIRQIKVWIKHYYIICWY